MSQHRERVSGQLLTADQHCSGGASGGDPMSGRRIAMLAMHRLPLPSESVGDGLPRHLACTGPTDDAWLEFVQKRSEGRDPGELDARV